MKYSVHLTLRSPDEIESKQCISLRISVRLSQESLFALNVDQERAHCSQLIQ